MAFFAVAYWKAKALTTAQCDPWGSSAAQWCRGIAAESAPSCGRATRWQPEERGAETRGSTAPRGNSPGSGRSEGQIAGQAAVRWPGAWQEKKTCWRRGGQRREQDVKSSCRGTAVVLCRHWLHGGVAAELKGGSTRDYIDGTCYLFFAPIVCSKLLNIKFLMMKDMFACT